ncbi:hypothetical protein M427DRAFT_148152, partial [Gonapodya prolifera JEL478]
MTSHGKPNRLLEPFTSFILTIEFFGYRTRLARALSFLNDSTGLPGPGVRAELCGALTGTKPVDPLRESPKSVSFAITSDDLSVAKPEMEGSERVAVIDGRGGDIRGAGSSARAVARKRGDASESMALLSFCMSFNLVNNHAPHAMEPRPVEEPSIFFVAVGDGYTGYYAVEEAVRVKAFDKVAVAIIAQEANKDLESLNYEVVEARPINIKVTLGSQGSTVAFIIPPARPDKFECTQIMLRGMKEARVENVVLLSTVGTEDAEGPQLREFQRIEDEAQSSGIQNLCIVRAGFYMQNLLLHADQFRESFIELPIGDSKIAAVDIQVFKLHDLMTGIIQQTIALQDMSLAVVRLCQQLPSGKHSGKTYTLTGPSSVSGWDIAQAAMSAMGGPEIEFRDVPPDLGKAILAAKPGLDDAGGFSSNSTTSHAKEDWISQHKTSKGLSSRLLRTCLDFSRSMKLTSPM